MATSQGVVRTYYTLTALFNLSASLIWGVNTLFLLAAGLSIFEAFAANAIFTAGMVLFEIPTGVVADTRGRRLSFLLAIATLFAGTIWYILLYHFGGAFVWWGAASVVLGLGFTFYSGAVDAWFVDALRATGNDDELDPYFARNAQFFAGSTLVGTVTGGLLGSLDLVWPYVVRGGLLGALLLFGFIAMKDLGFDTRAFRWRHVPREIQDIAAASWEHGWRVPRVRALMLMSFLHMGFLMWGWYAWQPYFLQLLGQELIWVAGVIAALVFLLMMIGNEMVRRLHGRIKGTTLLVIASVGLAAAMFGVGYAPSFYPAVGIFLTGMFFFGLIGPIKQSALHRLIPSKQRATIISFDGLLGSAGGVGSQIGLARLAEEKGYAAGYLVGGAMTGLAIPIAWWFKKRDDEARRGGPGTSARPEAGSPPTGTPPAPVRT